MSLPKSIKPCPILDALFEVRFSTKIHPSAIFGMVYNVLHSDYPKVENLPILQLPEAVRANDPNLKHKPYYKISNEEFVIQVGPEVLSISSFPQYSGWGKFSSKIFDTINRIEEIGVFKQFSRIGIRYINFFESNIFKNIELDVSIGTNNIEYKNTIIRTEIEHELFKSSLQIANNVKNQNIPGSIIDIDTFLDSGLDNFLTEKERIINLGHQNEKELFFSLLKKDFLKDLNPIY